jgi:hypothetical protein
MTSAKMVSTTEIEDGMTIAMLNKIGSKNLSYLGALVQKWENMADEGVSFTEWVLNNTFVDSIKQFADATKQHSTDVSGNMKYLKNELDATKKELRESKADISRLLEANKDLCTKVDHLLNPKRCTIDDIRSILINFNKENPVAVANGGGVTFDGCTKIFSVESLGTFLATVHARKLGVPSNILTTFKVFVLEGKLVTLSDDYHGGVGYSFLWKKKKNVRAAVGWASVAAKRYDPRLGVDPATGVNYIDPETGKMWIHPVLPASEPKKRVVSDTSSSSSESSESLTKKMRSGDGSSVSGSVKNDGVKEEEEEVFI